MTYIIKNVLYQVYTSDHISGICECVLEQIVNDDKYAIKVCAHCGRYFIPVSRKDEIYCDLPNDDGHTCREKGARQTYKEKMDKDPVLLEYRKAYQKKFMEVSRSNGDEQKKEEFEDWKILMQEMLKEHKENKDNSKITKKILKWIQENK